MNILRFCAPLMLLFILGGCTKEEVVKEVKINSITVTNFPTTYQGENWDFLQTLGADADIFIAINVGGAEVWKSTTYYEDCSNSFEYEFVPPSPVRVQNMSSEVTIELFDWDTLLEEYMTGLSFSFEGISNTRPSVETYSTDDFTIRLSLDWIME